MKNSVEEFSGKYSMEEKKVKVKDGRQSALNP
jgi:hypothetical protein